MRRNTITKFLTREWLLTRVVRSSSFHLAGQGLNARYSTPFRMCGLVFHFSRLSFRVCTDSLLGPSPLGWVTKKKYLMN